MGSLWKKVYQLLCTERRLPEEMMDRMRSPSPDERRDAIVVEAIEVILENSPHCGRQKLEITATDPEDIEEAAPREPALHDLSPEEALSGRQQASLMEAIFQCLTAPEESFPLGQDLKRLSAKLLDLRSELKLTPFEHQFLSLYSEEDATVSSAGKKLGLRIDQASGRLRRLMARIDEAMAKVSLKKELCGLLD